MAGTIPLPLRLHEQLIGPLSVSLLPVACTGTADFLEKASRACRRALHGEQGNTSWGWAQRSTEKKPAMAWLYQWRRALPCLHLFVLLRKRDMGVRYAQPGTESSPLGPGTAQLIFLSLSDQWEMDV